MAASPTDCSGTPATPFPCPDNPNDGGNTCVATAAACTTATGAVGTNVYGGTSGTTFASNAGLSSGNLVTTVSSIIRTIMGFLGIVAVVIILFGGFQWMTAAGSPEKVKHAKTLMIQGVIGLVIVLAAFAIASFVINGLVSATG
jgi:hypothetical protein